MTHAEIIQALTADNPAKRIARETAGAAGITLTEILSKGPGLRAARYNVPRQYAMLRIYRETGMSLPQIGRMFSGRDHTTVLSNIRAAEERLAQLTLTPTPASKPSVGRCARVHASGERCTNLTFLELNATGLCALHGGGIL